MNLAIWPVLLAQILIPALINAFPAPQVESALPGFNSSSSNAVKDYLAYPSEPFNVDLNAQALLQMRQIAGEAEVTSIEGGGFPSRPKKVVAWIVKIDESRLEEIKATPGVRACYENGRSQKELALPSEDSFALPSLAKIRTQNDAPPDLDVVSWAPGSPFSSLKGYVYDTSAGLDTFIYVIENGISPENPKDESQDSHGSCVASKAAGHRFGVSKSSVLVIVKAGLDDASTIEALALAQSDIITKKRQGRAVLIFARASDPPTPPGGLAPAVPWDSVRDLMDDLTMLDVPIVVPSGNDGIKSVDRVPALWATPQFGSMPLLVTGAVDTEGVQSKFSQGSLRDGFVWAPGTNVQCANGAVGDTTRSGTSFAASMVAGLVAYFLGASPVPFSVGNGQTAANALAYIQKKASWQRLPGGQKVIWNLQDGATGASLAQEISVS